MATYDYNGRNIWDASNTSPSLTYYVDTDRRDIDISNEISYLVPEATPFLTILLRARMESVGSTEYIWYDQGAPTWYTQINNGGGYSDSDTEIVVDDGSFIRAKDIIKNTTTGEIMYVSDVSTNTLTVVREYGYDSDTGTGTEAAEMSDNDYILRLGNAMEENSSAPDTHVTQPSKFFNYIQTLRTTFDGSYDNEYERKTAGGSERLRIRKDKLIEHRVDMEHSCLLGERKEDVTNKRKMTGGIMQFITTNSYDVSSTNSGILTEAELENICEMAFKYNAVPGNPKLFMTSRKIGGIINQFAAGRINTTSGDESYGLRLKKFESFHGDLWIVPSLLFEHDYEDTALILDMPNIDLMYFAGMKSTLRANIQAPDLDGWKDEYMSKFGTKVRNQETHTVVSGISA